MKIHLACGGVEAVLASAPLAESWLTDSESARLARLVTNKRRSQFLAARWQARWLLAQAFGGLPHDWPLQAPEDAPPCLAGRADLHLSISHSGSFTACAAGAVPMGLDLEAPPDRRRDVAGLIDLCCTPAERLLLVAPQREALFHELWTVKEAWLKRRGEWIAPKRLQELDAKPAEEGDVRTWTGEGWRIALCTQEEATKWHTARPVPVRRWQVADGA
ncbi:4'-phosphopantetheinyl transferase superfamily protein [Ramlibacter sp. G-1-2-2]|uniref:4'-phosphopantetheinyl transferase superfamily protein n=1 Tax=Ramlibacter agri TaxID=2728837 RepID=A0A848GYX3_9BURK|nr:4'-phosphopantetheinyl transferase superfamily protein [Ramlibacter agri]NML42591.1 4'-phosphopantetheinyl transferase superfamily protein [Ramlibacter agri]